MKRRSRGSRDNQRGGRKKNEKEVRNARGLKDVLGGRTNTNPQGASELTDFLSERKKSRGPAERQAPAVVRRNDHASPKPQDEATESRATPKGVSNNISSNTTDKPVYFWTVDGPMVRPAGGGPARPDTRGKAEQPRGFDKQNRNEPPPRFHREYREEEEELESEEEEVEAEAEEPARAPSVYNRSSQVQNMFRTPERLRSPVETPAKKFKQATPELEGKFEDGADEESRKTRQGKAGNRHKNKKPGKKGRRDRIEDKPQQPIYFDDRRSGKDRRDVRTPEKAFDGGQIEGVVKRHPDGFGFVIPDNKEIPDVYVPRNYMSGVMTNDRVRVEVYSSRHADRVFGEIKEVIKHSNARVVGAYLPVDQKYGMILGEGKGWGCDLRIASRDSMSAQEGDIVAVEVLSYPSDHTEFTGRVIEIIGDLEEPLNDVKRVIFGSGIPNEFSAEAIRDARKYGKTVTEKEIKGRADLRAMPLITIDGATARDFDDAIYVEQDQDGFKLWVAIADVSHYVKPGTKLDEEAYERGTSTYFPNYVVPMLPEELSNELCSLNPNVDRLCFVCEMDIDFQGHISSSEFYEGVMRSQARVTYGEAQEVIDGHIPPKLKQVAPHIRDAADLAKILMAKRFREGSLDLEIPETQVVVNEAGQSVDIIKSSRLFAHRLIEEMMLAANISTARFIDEHNIPGIYRIHEEPFDDNIKTLQRFLFNFGAQKSMTGGKLQKKITRALQAFEGKPEAQVLNILTLRSMQQAKYSSHNVGHFGLGFSHYSHFTSPIRRYPDLIAHRLIKSIIYPAYSSYQMEEGDLESAATMLSACEQRSVKAERQVIAIKKARFIKQFEGEEFEGLISSVTKFGVFVLLRAYDVDGLVKIEDLGDDRFIFDEENLRLFGKRSGMSYSIGDVVQVLVASVDTEAGRIGFQLAGSEEIGAPTRDAKKNRKNVQKRGKTKNHSRGVRKERISKRR